MQGWENENTDCHWNATETVPGVDPVPPRYCLKLENIHDELELPSADLELVCGRLEDS
jgi:hypothetical protein